MKNLYLHNAQVKIELADKPFASGGEGVLYHIKAPAEFRHSVAKLYHPPKRTKKKEEKLKYLLKNPPHESVKNFKQNAVVWIQDLIYQDKKFIGLILPFVHGKKLEVLCTTNLPKQLNKGWQRFSLANPKSMEFRLRVCFNLAAAIYQIHASQSYVLVDLKPDNVIIGRNGLVSIVDTDSVEVLDEYGQVLYKAPVATPEYTPVEYYRQRYSSKESVQQTWDRFGLAVIFYKILFGIHPFAASNTAPYDQLTTLSDKIREGLFVHSPAKQQYMKVVPPPHQRWSKLPSTLQQLFILCFERGHEIPELRPSAEEWCANLATAIGDINIENTFKSLLVRHQIIKGQKANHIVPKLLIEADKNEKLKFDSAKLLASFVGKEKMPVLYSKIPDWTAYRKSFTSGELLARDRGRIMLAVIFALLAGGIINVFLGLELSLIGAGVGIVLWTVYVVSVLFKRRKHLEIVDEAIEFRTKYDKGFKQLHTGQIKLKEQVEGFRKVVIRRKTETLLEYKRRIEALEEQRKSVFKEEKEACINLFKQSLSRLKQNHFISAFAGADIEDIELRIRQERQEILTKIKKESKPDKMRFNKDRLLFLERSKEVEKQHKKDLKILHQNYEKQLEWTAEKRQQELANIDIETSQNVSLQASAKHYLKYPDQERARLILELRKRGLVKVKHVAKIDYLAGAVQLSNEESTVIQLDEVSDNPISLAMMLNNWKKSVKNKKGQKEDKKRHVYKLYALKLEDVEQHYKRQKELAFRKKEADILMLKSQTAEEIYKQELNRHLGEHDKALAFLEKVRKGQETALSDIKQQYEARFEKMHQQADELDSAFRNKLEEQRQKAEERLAELKQSDVNQEIIAENNKVLLEINEISKVYYELEAAVIESSSQDFDKP